MFLRWLRNVLVALDQLANAIALGDPDETISSRAGKAMQEGKRWGCVLCRCLDLLQKDHCLKSIESDEGARALFPENQSGASNDSTATLSRITLPSE
ncbi:hypothetical protein [Caballeronia sp. LZ032]|uniref:hypothetical protein n=1 Tax=Caballeronia sp. LZ032 TaxID=3038565 RepID=UPI0028629A38|nr:hypothetical protein [Caballeronia sp. LZ032]MDR5883617.1 hypothetical protein [Caballeronia sp. LZ032]